MTEEIPWVVWTLACVLKTREVATNLRKKKKKYEDREWLRFQFVCLACIKFWEFEIALDWTAFCKKLYNHQKFFVFKESYIFVTRGHYEPFGLKFWLSSFFSLCCTLRGSWTPSALRRNEINSFLVARWHRSIEGRDKFHRGQENICRNTHFLSPRRALGKTIGDLFLTPISCNPCAICPLGQLLSDYVGKACPC